jgi:hypothetical protein
MLLTKTLQKQGQLMSVATKVGIQINAKLGGEIWSVQIPVCSFLFFFSFLFFVRLVKNNYGRWY